MNLKEVTLVSERDFLGMKRFTQRRRTHNRNNFVKICLDHQDSKIPEG